MKTPPWGFVTLFYFNVGIFFFRSYLLDLFKNIKACKVIRFVKMDLFYCSLTKSDLLIFKTAE